MYAIIVNIYTRRNSKKNVSINYSLGLQMDLMIFYKVGYLNNISDKWNMKKNGWKNVPNIANNPYAI